MTIETIATTAGLGCYNNLHYPGKDSIVYKRLPIDHDNRYVGSVYRQNQTFEILCNATRTKTDTFIAGLKGLSGHVKPFISVSEIKALDSASDPRVISRIIVKLRDV